MKKHLFYTLATMFSLPLAAQEKNISLPLPDSIKAISIYTEITPGTAAKGEAGIRTDVVSLKIEKEGDEKSFEFEFPKGAAVMARGEHVEIDNDEIEWEHSWTPGQLYKLLVSMAADSAGNFSLYSAYVGLPGEQQWKLLGTCRIEGQWSTIRSPAWFSTNEAHGIVPMPSSFWVLRQTGGWKSLQGEDNPPVIQLAGHVDSTLRVMEERRIIEMALKEGKIQAKQVKDDVHYQVLREGTGRQVQVTDTVTVHYKGWLLESGEVFDQTRETPARFPLNRLIRGWQIGVPLIKEGGKILLVIPSHLAYSIRTRAATIPPNSVLVFEVEVVSNK
jgi:hypothetical protein